VKQRGRKSPNDPVVIPIGHGRKRLEPPPDLTAAEASLFREVVASCSIDHFVQSDVAIVISYVQATLFVRRAAKALASDAGLVATWERAIRTQTLLARACRLTPQSRSDPKTVARRQAAHRQPSAYDLMADDDAG
jgi:hypothetical protein